jgi:hypothetical protein
VRSQFCLVCIKQLTDSWEPTCRVQFRPTNINADACLWSAPHRPACRHQQMMPQSRSIRRRTCPGRSCGSASPQSPGPACHSRDRGRALAAAVRAAGGALALRMMVASVLIASLVYLRVSTCAEWWRFNPQTSAITVRSGIRWGDGQPQHDKTAGTAMSGCTGNRNWTRSPNC